MNIKPTCILGLSLAFLVIAPASAAAPANIAFSNDGTHSVEVLQPTLDQVEVLVSRHSEGDKTILWSRSFEWEQTHRAFTSAFQALVSNDGQSVALRQPHDFTRHGASERILLVHKNGNSLVIPHESLSKLLPKNTGRLGGFAYIFSGSLELMLDQEQLYALWSAATDRWLVVSLTDLSHSLPSDENLIAQLNEGARAHALTRVRAHQPGAVKSALNALKTRLAGVLPGFDAPSATKWLTPETSGAYLFLTVRRNPSDKHFIQGLLNFPLDLSLGAYSSEFKFNAELGSSARLLGDQLLHHWENPDDELHFEGFHLRCSKDPIHLAALAVELHLPIPISDNMNQPGNLWVYLIPSKVRPGDWPGSSAIIPLGLDPLSPAYQFPSVRERDPSRARFVFSSVHPGQYRLKAVWDRRPPFAAPKARLAIPGAGDYETSESSEFTLKAGDLEYLVLHCTNRLSGPQEYYLADELRAQSEFPDGGKPYPYPLLFTAPVDQWVLPINPLLDSSPLDQLAPATKPPLEIVLKNVALLQSPARDAASDLLELEFGWARRKIWSPSINVYTVSILDQNGRWSGGNPYSANRGYNHELKVHFQRFPRRGTFEVQVFTPHINYEKHLAASFTLTNLAHFFHSGSKPANLPLRVDCGEVIIELPRLKPLQDLPAFRFIDDRGDALFAWRAAHLAMHDQDGNPVTSLRGLPPGAVVNIEADFLRDFRDHQTSWALPVPELPAPGQYQELEEKYEWNGLAVDLLAITGKGQFEYEDGRIVAASSDPDLALPAAPNQLPPVKPNDVQLVYFTQNSHHPPGSPHRDTVVSRVPHLALRMTGVDDCYFRLDGERIPDWYSPRLASAHPDHTWFIPLNRTTISNTQRLTLRFQKAIRQQFTIRIPNHEQ